MMYFTETGRTHQELILLIRDKYGPDATVLSRKKITVGGFLGFFQKDGLEYSGYVSSKGRPKLSENDKKEQKKILDSVKVEKKREDSLQKILDEVKSLKEDIKSAPSNEGGGELPSLLAIENYLFENDFSLSYIKKTLDRLKAELPFAELNDFEITMNRVNSWIEESITIHQDRNKKRNVFILVGPTGVGKTTTIAKLAAQKGLGIAGSQKYSVRMITIDNYRIAAKKQIETYGEIMGIPVTCCESYEDLKREIDINSDVDYIFVDTIGKSPKDFVKLAEMRRILEGCGQECEVHLAFSATTKTWDIREIMKQYNPFGYDSVIITKLDETTRCGNLISLLHEQKQKVSYITTGQMVPQDIEVATKEKIMSLLVGSKQVTKG
ncbi:flagellar biosynthesis protein FlhF [Thiospirochaeta perfilievii]|uniref:Flagellar biosynthesis protein FlhF n=1 Tax=Thiospirochaeta perfilievii TaxID=252967 RepID=A0A5C1QEM3_9SPIO|nr:flagellar biosynthesis protein FlhF [Thiospirochaeta perfilievii]QEN06031.1 flagellar biosynthesis protein FlhF [Thiospirochaeta perfilievii]